MTSEHTHNPFSSAWLERRSEARLVDDWHAQALADPLTRFLAFSGTQHLARTDEPGIAWLGAGDPLLAATGPGSWLLLGWQGGHRIVMVDGVPAGAELPAQARFEDLRPLLPLLPEDDASLLASARALAYWRLRHRHCGACGAPMRARSAGHVLVCTSSECGAEFFPRIDPAVIVLVDDGERALLGRQRQWPAGRYSCLAGFVEPGESLEDTVVREVFEEAGVRARRVRYYGSQPWPFPSSLMLGFRALADHGPLQLDGELEDARWFSPAELMADPQGRVPPRHTIARRLIDAWLTELTGQALPAGA